MFKFIFSFHLVFVLTLVIMFSVYKECQNYIAQTINHFCSNIKACKFIKISMKHKKFFYKKSKEIHQQIIIKTTMTTTIISKHLTTWILIQIPSTE